MTTVSTTSTTKRKLQAPAKLKVIPNLYHSLDHQGRPSGTARRDPAVSAGLRLYIGAKLDEAVVLETRSPAQISAGMAPTRQVNFWSFQTNQPVEIEDTAWHRDLLRHGSVFAFDESTHTAVFGASPKRPFVDPKTALAKSREKAIEHWKDGHDGAEPIFVQEEAEASAGTPAPAAPVAAPPAPVAAPPAAAAPAASPSPAGAAPALAPAAPASTSPQTGAAAPPPPTTPPATTGTTGKS